MLHLHAYTNLTAPDKTADMRILIAEDDEVLRDGLCRSMRQSGYAVDCAGNGKEAVQMLQGETV